MLAFNQFVNPWALDVMGWKYVSFVFCSAVVAGTANHLRAGQYLVYCCWLVFELAFVLTMIVETKGSQCRSDLLRDTQVDAPS